MTIIRNDRNSAKRAQEAQAAASQPDEEPEVDYTWRPTIEDFDPQISVDQWIELLSDGSVFDQDALSSIEHLNDYGGPATFQQLSVRYGGTMGRYRRWLNDAAERVCAKQGIEAPQFDQFGNAEWWPVLYQQRPAGKIGANRFEMRVREELSQALAQRSDAANQKKAAAQREAAEAEAKARAEASRMAIAERLAAAQAKADEEAKRAAERAEAEARAEAERRAQEAAQERASRQAVQEEIELVTPAKGRYQAPVAEPHTFASVGAFLEVMADEDDAFSRLGVVSKFAGSAASRGGKAVAKAPASRERLDYARVYSERLYDVLDLLSEGDEDVTVASLARALGDESVSELQSYLNADEVPGFAYLDRVAEATFANVRRLELTEDRADTVPAFDTLRERCGAKGAAAFLDRHVPERVIFVVDDSKSRRTGVILQLSDLGYVLLERTPVNADADRTKDQALKMFLRMVRDLDDYSKRSGMGKESVTISSSEWDALAAGLVWPGTIVMRHE